MANLASVDGLRIAWLSSARLNSHIHRTVDNGVTTVCGHDVYNKAHVEKTYIGGEKEGPRWIVVDGTDPQVVPRSDHGRSQYCL